MIPIGILTKDRVPYLDITLRSLSATTLPPDIRVTLYDDGSSHPHTLSYYNTRDAVPVSVKWPTDLNWRMHGLDLITREERKPVGIQGQLPVQFVPLGGSQGVVYSSCWAISDLFTKHPEAAGAFLLQDDVLFNANWYDRMLQTVDKIGKQTGRPVGLLAGMKLNQLFRHPQLKQGFIESGITAQCLYVSRIGFEACNVFFEARHTIKMRFDDYLRRAMAAKGMWAGCVYPFVCQHFGITSLVRPARIWRNSAGGRVGYHSKPPYVLAESVRDFGGASCR